MSHVSGGELGLIHPAIKGLLQLGEVGTQGRITLRPYGETARQTGAQDARVDTGEEEGRAEPLVGDAVAVGARHALNEPVQRKCQVSDPARSADNGGRGWTTRALG